MKCSRMKRVLFIRGNQAPPWEAPILEHLNHIGYKARFLVSSINPSISNNLQIAGRNLNSSLFLNRMLNKSLPARFLNYALNIKTSEFTSKYFQAGDIFRDNDIIHLVDDIYSPGLQASRVSEKLVMTVWENIPYHFGIENGYPTNKYRKKIFSQIKKFLPVTQESRKYLISAGISEDLIEVVHPGINLYEFKNISPVSSISSQIAHSERTIILGVARMEYFKGITFVLRALKELRSVRKDFLYVHVGIGPEKFVKYVRDMVNAFGLKENVLLLGGGKLYRNAPDI